jgi:hypothetical protein
MLAETELPGPYALVETSKLKASCPACGQAIHPLFRKWDCRYGERPVIEIIPYV